jgi:hypothetical protein
MIFRRCPSESKPPVLIISWTLSKGVRCGGFAGLAVFVLVAARNYVFEARVSYPFDVTVTYCIFHVTYPKQVFAIVSRDGFKPLFLRQFLTDLPEIKTGCSPICILCA